LRTSEAHPTAIGGLLLTVFSAINQQIATKTIKKLGFGVTAVWNGREALDYLNEAKEGKHAKPAIILMDVQMPIIDGYRCTHLLRHHVPYKSYVWDVPIVAMTASAIQGDREKCTRAGMDDYLAKPVKSKILEKMLVRWCAAGRRSLPRPPSSERAGSECAEELEQCNSSGIPTIDGMEYEEPASQTNPRVVVDGEHGERGDYSSPSSATA
jgi:CheY-like chemotaxis protein